MVCWREPRPYQTWHAQHWPTSAICKVKTVLGAERRGERKKQRNVQILLQVIIASWSHANGALVMMVLSKGNLEEFFSMHNARRPVARRRDATGEWIKVVVVDCIKKEKARARRGKFHAFLYSAAARPRFCCHPSPPGTFGTSNPGGSAAEVSSDHSQQGAPVGGPWDLSLEDPPVAPWMARRSKICLFHDSV